MKYSRLSRKDWKEIFPAMSRVTSRLVSCNSMALLLHIRINIFLQRFDILLQGRMCWSSSALSAWLVSNVSYRPGVGYHLDRAIWCRCNNWSKFGLGGSEWLVVLVGWTGQIFVRTDALHPTTMNGKHPDQGSRYIPHCYQATVLENKSIL